MGMIVNNNTIIPKNTTPSFTANLFRKSFLPKKLVSHPDTFQKLSPVTLDNVLERCVEALKSPTPFEKSIIFDKFTGQILQITKGDALSCPIDLKMIKHVKSKNLILVHSHLSQIQENGELFTAPVSLADFRVLNKSSLKSIIAVDQYGKTSALEKKNNFKKISDSQQKKIEKDLFIELFSSLSREKKNKISELMEKDISGELIEGEITNIIEHQQMDHNGMKALDYFWKKIAEKYDLEYKSDMVY